MLQFVKDMLGFGAEVNFAELVKNGAQIIDVRTKGEFSSGHIKGSVNIPLDTISSQISKIKKDKPVITCCASGMRSASAKSILEANGFTQVYNGGGWAGLQSKINQS
jgi:rhodanese-related sulfurtransferase